MRKIILISVILLLSANANGQSIPRLKPLSEKQMTELIQPAEKKGKWGYANARGRFLIKPVYDSAEVFKIAEISVNDTVFLAKILFNDKWGLLKTDGTYLIEPQFDEIRDFNQFGIAKILSNDKWGLLKNDGTYLIEPQFDEIRDFNQFGQAWYKTNNTWGVVSADGTEILSNIYSEVATESLSNKLLKTIAGTKYGIIETPSMRVVKEPIFDSIYTDNRCKDLIIYQEGDMLGCMTADGINISFPQYEEIKCVSYRDLSRIMIKKDGKYGVIDGTGKQIIPPSLQTDQISSSNTVLQFWDDSWSGYNEPYLYYRDRRYGVDSFDDFIYNNYDKERYCKKNDENIEFPYWMKRNLNKALGRDDALIRWRFDDAFYPFLENVSNTIAKRVTDVRGEYYIEAGKDMKVTRSYGFDYEKNNQLTTSRIIYNDYECPIGNYLASLFKSVDSNKIKKYDSLKGTSIFYNWHTISFRISGLLQIDDSHIITCIDMYIDDFHMQRTVAKLNKKGECVYSIKENGLLYDTENYIEDEFICVLSLGETIIVSSVSAKSNIPSTSVYYNGGKTATLDMFCCSYCLESDNYRFYCGLNSSYDDRIYIYSDSADINNVEAVIDFETEYFNYSNDLLLIFDRQSNLLKRFCSITSPDVMVPALRYVMSDWDGDKVVGISKNSWDNIDDAQWEVIPKVTQTFERHFHIGDIVLSVLPANSEGNSVYRVKYEEDPIEYARYGFIGFDKDFFTLPVFEDAQWISIDSVRVLKNSKWGNIAVTDLESYKNNPRGAFSPSIYPVGSVIFNEDFINKAIADKSYTIRDHTNSEGYYISHSYGGNLIPYQYTITGKWGFVNKRGEMVVAPIYDGVFNTDYSVDNLAAVLIEGNDTQQEFGISYGWGFVNMNGDLIVPCKYNYIRSDLRYLFESNGLCILATKQEDGLTKIGAIDKNGKTIIPFIYDDIYVRDTDSFIATVNSEKKIINKYGEILTNSTIPDSETGIEDGAR